MGSIDGHKYPDRDAEEMVEMADVLVNKHGGEVSSQEKFAQDLGHSTAKSGTFNQKLADARKFKILPNRGLKAQEITRKLANPKDEREESENLFRMYKNISLLDRLYSHLNGDEPPAEFWRILTEITDANPKEAKKTADDIKQLYLEMLQHEPEETEGSNKATSEPETSGSDRSSKEPRPTDSGIFVQIGNNTLSLDSVSIMNIRLARTMLEQIEERLKRQGSSRGEDENESGSGEDLHGDGLENFTD